MKNHYKQIAIALLMIWAVTITMAYFKPEKKQSKSKAVSVKIITEKEKMIAIIKRYEKFLPVREKQNGKYYIGYGHQCLNDEFTEIIDTNVANQILNEDLQFYIDKLEGWNLTERKKLAVASFCFNFGWGYFLRSDLYKLIKSKKPVSIEWLKNRKYKKILNDRLQQRRIYECYLYLF